MSIARLLMVLFILISISVCAQDYPTKPIHVMSGSGATEAVARVVTQGMATAFGQPMVVEVKGGNAQFTAINAPPDGYTILISGSSLWLTPLTQKVPFDPQRDVVPVSILGKTPYILFTTPSLPGTVKDLIAYAKARPGQLYNTHGGDGGAAHLAGELFKSLAGVQIIAVPYSNGSQEMTDLVSGRVHLTFTTPLSLMGQVKAGKLRALAVTTAEPSALFPELPTMAAAGLPGFEWGQTTAMVAPVKTPAPIIQRLYQEAARYLQTSDAKEKLAATGVEAVGSSPEDLAAKIKTDIAKVEKLIKDAGLKFEK